MADTNAQNQTQAPAGANTGAQRPAGANAGAADDSTVHRSAALYVGDLDPKVNEADLFEIFNAMASVASVRVCRHAISRQSLGYAYVNFHTIVDAEKVLDTMNYTQIKGRMSRLMWSQRDPSFRRAGNGNIFVKNLDPKIDSKDLNDLFSPYGNIVSCKVVTERESGKSRGYGFVHFEKEEEALAAIAKINGTVVADRTIFVGKFEPAERRHKKQQWTNLFVKNIPDTWDEAKLSSVFSEYGEIASITIVKAPEPKKNADGEVVADEETHKGYGFVDYKEHESAVAAQEALNAKEVPGEFKTLKNSEEPVPLKLYVGRFQKKRERQRLLQERRTQAKAARIKEFLGKNLYVRNLAEDCTDEMLRKLFAAHGAITSAKVMKNDNGQSRGFGFVCFASQSEASKAHKALQSYLFMNKPLHIAMWQPREERQQFLRRLHEVRLPNGARGGMPGAGPSGLGPSGLVPMMQPGGYMPMFPGPLGGYPRPMFGRGPAGPQGPGAQQPQYGYAQQPQYGGRGNLMVGRGGGRGRGRGGRGGGRGDMQQMQHAMAQQLALEQQQQLAAQQLAAQQAAQAQAQAQAQPQAQPQPTVLSAQILAQASPAEQKNMIGEKLYPEVMRELEEKQEPADRAGKITGMLLDGVDTPDLLDLLESPAALKSKVEEALKVLIDSSAQ